MVEEQHGVVTTSAEEFEKTIGVPRQSTLLVGEAKAYFKCVCHLYEIFPELKYLPVNTSRLRDLLLQLCELQLFTTVRKLAVLFPEELDTHFLRCLVSVLICV